MRNCRRNRGALAPRRDDLLFPFEQTFDQFFTDFFSTNPVTKVKNSCGYPKMDVVEADGKFTVSVAASGVASDDLDVEVTPDNVLVVKGRMSEEHRSPEDATYHLRELRMSAFERAVQLPDYLEGDPKATMKDGLLTLVWEVPVVQEEEAPQTRKIAIEKE